MGKGVPFTLWNDAFPASAGSGSPGRLITTQIPGTHCRDSCSAGLGWGPCICVLTNSQKMLCYQQRDGTYRMGPHQLGSRSLSLACRKQRESPSATRFPGTVAGTSGTSSKEQETEQASPGQVAGMLRSGSLLASPLCPFNHSRPLLGWEGSFLSERLCEEQPSQLHSCSRQRSFFLNGILEGAGHGSLHAGSPNSLWHSRRAYF